MQREAWSAISKLFEGLLLGRPVLVKRGLERCRRPSPARKVSQGSAADDVASEVVDALIKHIAANPAKSTEWKAEADAKLKETDGD